MKRPKNEEEMMAPQPIDSVNKNMRHMFGLLVEKDWKTAEVLVKLMKEGDATSQQIAEGFQELIGFLKALSAGKELKPALKYPDSLVLSEELDKIMPEISQEDYNILKEDIGNKGILAPLVVQDTPEGLLLIDGYTRYRVAEELGIKRLPVIVATSLINPKMLAMTINTYRRHLTKEDKWKLIGSMPIPKKGRPKKGEERPMSREELAESMGMSPRNVDRARAKKKSPNGEFSRPKKSKKSDKMSDSPTWINRKDLDIFREVGHIKGCGFIMDFKPEQMNLDLLCDYVDRSVRALQNYLKENKLLDSVDHFSMEVKFEARKKDI